MTNPTTDQQVLVEARRAAAETLLHGYTEELRDAGVAWEVKYRPKGNWMGGGITIRLSKDRLMVTDVMLDQ